MLDRYVVVVNYSILRPVATTFGILEELCAELPPCFHCSAEPTSHELILDSSSSISGAPSGTRIELSNRYVAEVENEIRQTVAPRDLGMIVSNIGITPDLSAIYTSNSSMDTAFVQVSLKEGHHVGSYEYMRRVRRKLSHDLLSLRHIFKLAGSWIRSVNQGLPAPASTCKSVATTWTSHTPLQKKSRVKSRVSEMLAECVLIPQNLKYPGLQLNIDRERASLIGLSPKEIVDNVITALTSNGMIAPSYWIDPNTGNNYMLTVQYFDQKIANMSMDDFKQIPLRAGDQQNYTPLQSVADIKEIDTPTEVDHYQIRRVIDVYVMPSGEALQGVNAAVNRVIAGVKTPQNVRITVRGTVVSMNESFLRFGVGLILSIALVYLILMAQFTSFIDPFIILMAIPPGLSGVLLILLITGSTLNVMSLMGVIMMTGIVVSERRFYRRIRRPPARRRNASGGSRCAIVQNPAAAHPYDLSCYAARNDSDGTRC